MEVKVARRHTKAPDPKLPVALCALYATFTCTDAHTRTVQSGVCAWNSLVSVSFVPDADGPTEYYVTQN